MPLTDVMMTIPLAKMISTVPFLKMNWLGNMSIGQRWRKSRRSRRNWRDNDTANNTREEVKYEVSSLISPRIFCITHSIDGNNSTAPKQQMRENNHQRFRNAVLHHRIHGVIFSIG
mmetsp:Transcript_21092/g.45703  ORF Transcript_21092/g.45703 Transcript_21092/m.45703 type:complete len:116 (-) Transcript_21092:891-1238(-)